MYPVIHYRVYTHRIYSLLYNNKTAGKKQKQKTRAWSGPHLSLLVPTADRRVPTRKAKRGNPNNNKRSKKSATPNPQHFFHL